MRKIIASSKTSKLGAKQQGHMPYKWAISQMHYDNLYYYTYKQNLNISHAFGIILYELQRY